MIPMKYRWEEYFIEDTNGVICDNLLLQAMTITMGLHVYPSITPIYKSLTLGLSAILPKHGFHFKQLLISSKVLNILIYCYNLLVKRSSMHLLCIFELKYAQ